MKPILIMLLCGFPASLLAQGTVVIKDIEIPTAPALMLLDNAPTNIETPKNIKAITAGILNGIGNNTALEFTPYFFLNTNKNFYNYNNFYVTNTSGTKALEYRGIFSGNVYSNLSVSFASVRSDTTSNLAIGIRTNLIKIQSRAWHGEFNKADALYRVRIRKLEEELDPEELAVSDEYKKLVSQYNVLLDSLVLLNQKPMFGLDAAVAYNHFFESNDYSEGRMGRRAAWLTASYNLSLDHDVRNSKNFLSLYAYGRYLKDNMTLDPETMQYSDFDFFDFGGKAEFELGNFSFAYEYVKRNRNDNYRSVGSIKYTIRESILLSGGFGRNFSQQDNLVSFLGISWGIDYGNEFSK